MSIAWEVAIEELSEDEWHNIPALVLRMADKSGMLPRSCMNILYEAKQDEAIQIKGKYIPHKRRERSNDDGRKVRIHPDGLPNPWHPDCKDEK